VAPDVEQLKVAGETWLRGASKDRLSNRLFLDLFAVYLVKHFRAEETRLQRMADPGLPWHRQEHRRLVRQTWGLMSDDLLGLDVTDGIHRILEAWALHQVSASLRPELPKAVGH
jgi:hemerythrin